MKSTANTVVLPNDNPSPSSLREFGPFVAECTKRGIGRTTAYALLDNGDLDTFTIGTKRFVYLDSLLTLPNRLAGKVAA